MLRHTWLMIIAAALLCGGAGTVAYLLLNQPTELTIAVGPPNSEDVRVVQSIAAQFQCEADEPDPVLDVESDAATTPPISAEAP